MKKIIKFFYLSILVLTIFCIYYIFNDNKINYTALGDALTEGMNSYGEIGYSYSDFLATKIKNTNKLANYSKYGKSGNNTSDLINNIEQNGEIKKNLRESDLVTVSIGANDLLSKIDIKSLNIDNLKDYKDLIKNIIPDIDKCIKIIRQYAKEKLIIVGYYNPIPLLFTTNGPDLDELFSYIDEEYLKIATEHNCEYISIYQLFKNNNYLSNPTNIHPNIKGYQEIANLIYKKTIEK